MSTTVSSIETTETEEVKKWFDVIYVGLICFMRDARIALMPDGTKPDDPNVAPDFPYVVVDPASITGKSGWDTKDQEQIDFMVDGIYRLPKCEIKITAATTPGKLNADHHDKFVPKLVEADPKVEIDPDSPNAIVRWKVGSGTMEAFRTPLAEEEDDDVAVLSRQRVDHTGAITVEVLENGKVARTLELAPMADIALANIAFPADTTKKGDDFSIFGKLTPKGKINGTPPPVAPRIKQLFQDHQFFRLGLPANDGTAKCGVRTCCPPPP